MELSLVGELADLNARVQDVLRKLYEEGAFKEIEDDFEKLCGGLPPRYTVALDFELKLIDNKGTLAPVKLATTGIQRRGKSQSDETTLTTVPRLSPGLTPLAAPDSSGVESEKVHGYQVVRIRKQIKDIQQVQEVIRAVELHLEGGAKKVALSFAGNSYPYSNVLSLLAQCQKTSDELGAELVVVCSSGVFLDVLRHTGLSKILRIVSSEDELQ